MKNLIFFFCIFSSFPLIAQETFIKTYDLNSTGGSFYNSILDGENIIIYGNAINEENSQWGIYWARLDTFGNVLQEQIHYDTLGDTYILEDTYELINTSDGGFAMVGNLLSRDWGFLMKLDINGNLEFVKEYPDLNITNTRHEKIIEISDGYLSGGRKQQLDDYKNDVFIMKIDFEGNKIWEINYGDFELYNGLRSILPLENNQYLLTITTSTGSTTGSNPNVPFITEAWLQQKIVIIDGEGNIISEEIGEEFEFLSQDKALISSKMYPDGDGNWVYKSATAMIEYISPDPEPFLRTKGRIVKVDSTLFNTVWEIPLGEYNGRNTFSGFTPTPDNGWLAVGKHRVEAQNPNQKNYQAGWLAKVDDYGNFLWSRTDTAFYAANIDEERIEHYLNSVVTLPSGSIIATGRISNYEEEPSRSYGWMIKLDKDGCLEPGCHPNLTGINFTEKLDEFEVYPNPTSDWVKVEGQGKFETEVYDSFGKQVLALEEHQDIGQLDLSLLPSGVYYVNILVGYFIYSKKVVRL